ncbi:F-actin-capping protein subunit beta [Cyphellophora attinorum]|uniref:F-actin-capping protein subunit beta n=1 Tax=Cyphellophora attinorum TaxID=1664694 RepID=A0A0N1NZ35_9EURO|nr:F-actin-capping protein subunit beta [Phialophora attinorum]KPI36702.1 F-actin-capping protein subunit beta [Phialophora attinorum]
MPSFISKQAHLTTGRSTRLQYQSEALTTPCTVRRPPPPPPTNPNPNPPPEPHNPHPFPNLDLLSSVDQPLTSTTDPSTSRTFLLCDYNRDGDSYRSPWSNKFYPPLPPSEEADATYPSERVRKMEVECNASFDVYRQMYYEGTESESGNQGGGAAIGSVYLWDLDEGFAGVVLLKKETGGKGRGSGSKAAWDSVHVFEVDERSARGGGAASRGTSHYKLTSTVILHLQSGLEGSSTSGDGLQLAGSMTRQVEADLAVESIGQLQKDGGHVVNIGRMVEDMEGKMRNLLQEVYFGKAKDVVGDLRSVAPLTGVRREREMQSQVMAGMGR